MSRSPETFQHTTGRTTGATGSPRAHRTARDLSAARTLAQRPPARYEPYLDGLFTYCLSVLCDHDLATAALGDALALAERRGTRAPGDHRAWLYALVRWSCLRRLAEVRRGRHTGHAQGRPRTAYGPGGPAGTPASAQAGPHAAAGDPERPPLSAAEESRRRRELRLLAWPEAAGTTPEQREALELAVRHQLAAHEVAAVLGTEPATARELLASAACEVERTRAALAVVETGTCPGVARLAGHNQLVLSSTLRRELVRHVDDCPRCRRTAERATPGAWPGTSVTPDALPVIEAPRAAVHQAMAHVSRARGTAPRFDRRGFPMDPKDHAARRDRLRSRAVTTTVVATVVAAPVLALWAAYRGAPLTGEGQDGRPIAAGEDRGADGLSGERAGAYENAGNADTEPDPGLTEDSGSDVSVEVLGAAGRQGALTVEAVSDGDTTLVTLRASGDAPVDWSARTGASWLYLSRSSGTLAAGESVTVKVYVDHLREPGGHWTARVAIAPAGAVVTIDGYGPAHPTRPGRPDPAPSTPHSTRPDPTTPGPTRPDPTTPPPSPDPVPSDPTPSEPPPTDSPPSDPDGGSVPPPSDGGDSGDSGDPSPSGT
ncbi:BACON domain-containing protein [Streptomyces minutiscleroticus]|uniref:BACON domain-containing protein n=1 Tax=Streptomyces minutiscleroticus TaxID=68238 RepID=UPI0033249C7A